MTEPVHTQAEPILSVEDLSVEFATEGGAVRAVRDVSLGIRPGETLALVGESGSGKSTVSLAVMGLLPANATSTGRVAVDGLAMLDADKNELSRARGDVISMVFQEPATALDPLTRVGDQIIEVIRNHRDVSRDAARQEAVELLRKVGVPDPQERISSFPFQLSGGQRQRVVIAMAVANQPKVLIADEPTTALDVTVQAEVLDLLRRLTSDMDTAVLLVTHNMGVVADFADRVAVMLDGQIVESGTVHDVLLRPAQPYTRKLLDAVPRLATTASPAGADRADQVEQGRPAEAIVQLTDVSVVFGRGRRAVTGLDGVSMSVQPGETVALVGESGSGKSTAARVALGLIAPTEGTVRLFGQDLHAVRSRERRSIRAGIGVVLQDPVASLDSRMSVAECISEPLRIHRRSMTRAQRGARVAELLEQVRLPRALAGRTPRELSGGQRQRVSLARALALRPRLIVADEPTSALDVSVQRTVLAVLTELQSELEFACLFVSHDLAVVQQFAERVLVMKSGRVVEEGSSRVTLVSPESDYTRRLLAAVPVADPVVQRERRAQRLQTLESRRSAKMA